MRYKIKCKSLLLQRALENFLDGYIADDGIIISDYEGDIVIGKDIKKPFSKSQLLLQLEAVWQKKQLKEKTLEIDMSIFNELIEEESFEQKLDKLIDNFAKDLKKLIKEEYAKK